jgi:hypothetical protein
MRARVIAARFATARFADRAFARSMLAVAFAVLTRRGLVLTLPV